MALGLFLLMTAFAVSAAATQIVDVGDLPNEVKLLEQDETGVTLRVNIGSIQITPIETKEGTFNQLTVDGLSRSFEIGEPNLPQAHRLLAILLFHLLMAH